MKNYFEGFEYDGAWFKEINLTFIMESLRMCRLFYPKKQDEFGMMQ